MIALVSYVAARMGEADCGGWNAMKAIAVSAMIRMPAARPSS